MMVQKKCTPIGIIEDTFPVFVGFQMIDRMFLGGVMTNSNDIVLFQSNVQKMHISFFAASPALMNMLAG